MFERARKRSKVWNWKIAIRHCNEKWTQQRQTRHKKIVAEVYEWEWQRESHIFFAFLRHTPTAQSAPLKRSETSPFGRWIGRFFLPGSVCEWRQRDGAFCSRKLRKLLWPQEKLWFSASVGKLGNRNYFANWNWFHGKRKKGFLGKVCCAMSTFPSSTETSTICPTIQGCVYSPRYNLKISFICAFRASIQTNGVRNTSKSFGKAF